MGRQFESHPIISRQNIRTGLKLLHDNYGDHSSTLAVVTTYFSTETSQHLFLRCVALNGAVCRPWKQKRFRWNELKADISMAMHLKRKGYQSVARRAQRCLATEFTWKINSKMDWHTWKAFWVNACQRIWHTMTHILFNSLKFSTPPQFFYSSLCTFWTVHVCNEIHGNTSQSIPLLFLQMMGIPSIHPWSMITVSMAGQDTFFMSSLHPGTNSDSRHSSHSCFLPVNTSWVFKVVSDFLSDFL